MVELNPVFVYVSPHILLLTGIGKPALKCASTQAYIKEVKINFTYFREIIDSNFIAYVKPGMVMK